MKRSDKNGYNWLFPEEAEIHLTCPSQIIAGNIQVAYSATAIIRCKISKETVSANRKLFQQI